ncbi:elicitin [Phytophthora sojae]|uniref:Elicitin n=2 Tax=Phytophthora sojae TaxID=67593 RepID=G4ZFX6_PHYSP|nr:elicitin [Phytophthora sojae]ABB56021.1 elicitin-like protein SOL1E [Phytophthora sojae]EGZ16660.1 elicitin [Phytophthora sojae]|eukprot:XP_009525718.1 elicitin [Phytophthora sojae]
MKIAVLVLCLAAAFGAAAAVAPPCNGTAMTQLLGTGDVRACSAMFGNSSASLEPPSDAQVTAVCNNNACMKSLGALKQVAPTECTIGPILLHANIIDPILQRCANKTRSAGSAGSVSASGSGAGPSVGDVSGSASGSGPMAGDVGGGGSATKSPATSKPRTNSPANPRTGSASKAPGNEAPTLSTCAAIVVLAAVVAALV